MPDVRWGKLGGGTQLLPDIDYFSLRSKKKTVRYLSQRSTATQQIKKI